MCHLFPQASCSHYRIEKDVEVKVDGFADTCITAFAVFVCLFVSSLTFTVVIVYMQLHGSAMQSIPMTYSYVIV